MVHKILIAIFLLAPITSAAQNVNLEFQSATISEVVQTLVKGIMQQDYSIAPEILGDERRISVSIKDKPREQVRGFLTAFLAEQGIAVTELAGVLYLSKLKGEPLEPIELDGVDDGVADLIESAAGSITEPPPEKITSTIYIAKHRSLSDFESFLKQSANANPAQQLNVSVDNDLAVITGTREQVALVRHILAHYDRPSNELEVKVSIIEYSDQTDQSINLFAALSALSGKLNINIGTRASLRDGISFGSSNFSAVLSAMNSDANFNILDTTTLRVVSGKQGRITVGQEVPVLGQFTLDQQGRQIQSVNYRSSGLIVDIKPNLIDDQVHAQVVQQLSSFAVTSTSNIDSPTLLKREIDTSLATNLNEVIVMGGLEEVRQTEAKTSFLGLPIGKQSTDTKTSLFLLLEFQRR